MSVVGERRILQLRPAEKSEREKEKGRTELRDVMQLQRHLHPLSLDLLTPPFIHPSLTLSQHTPTHQEPTSLALITRLNNLDTQRALQMRKREGRKNVADWDCRCAGGVERGEVGEGCVRGW
jgi:hypothetical protein